MEDNDSPPQEETFASAPTTDPSIAHTSGSVSADSSRLWRKFMEEQARDLLALTKDLIDNKKLFSAYTRAIFDCVVRKLTTFWQ